MSFRIQPAPVARPNRCQLFGPGSRPALFEKMAASAADVVNLDLEDSVAPNDKDTAREAIIDATHSVDWNTKALSIRINGLDTPYWYKDVVDVLERGSDRIDLIMIPKVGYAEDLYAVDALVTAIERAKGRKKPIGFEIIIETAAGAQNVDAIAQSTPRLQSMSFGVADYAASMGMQVTGIGGTQAGYDMLADGEPDAERDTFPADPWHYPVVRMVAACRQYGILPVDGPFGDFSDDAAFRAQARRSAILGCVGKWAIHPKQVALANEVFTPADEIVARARAILAAMDEAEKAGQGAAVLDGKLIDIASARQAKVVVDQIELIQGNG